MIKISVIPAPLVEFMWEIVQPHMFRLVQASHGDFTMDSLRDDLLSGNSGLITVTDGDECIAAITATVSVMPSGLRVLYIPGIAGDKMIEWIDQLYEVLKPLAKAYDCTEIRGSARPGWIKALKHLGFEPVHTVLGFKVEE